MAVLDRPGRVDVGGLDRDRRAERRRVGHIGRVRKEFLDRVDRGRGRDGHRPAGRVFGVPPVHGGLLHLVPDDEAPRCARAPTSTLGARIGGPQDVDEALGAGAEFVDQVAGPLVDPTG